MTAAVIPFPGPAIEPIDIEADLRETRTRTADAIHRDVVCSYEFGIGDDLHPYDRAIEGRRCPVCDGLFPLRGRCRAIRGPFDDQWRPIHTVCWIAASEWLPE